jgi:hypothetical protein
MKGILKITGDGFHPLKNKINDAVLEAIGDPQLANYYIISGDENPDQTYMKYSVKVPRNLLDIRN